MSASRRKPPRTGWTRPRVAITQNGGVEARQFLQRFVDAVGRGKVNGPYDYSKRYVASNLGNKPRYVVQYQSERDVEHVMSVLDPYITLGSPKRERYRELLIETQQRSGGERPS